MPLTLKPRSQSQSPLPPFTFSLPSPPSDVLAPSGPSASNNNNDSATGSNSASASASTSGPPPRPPAAFIPEKDMYMFGTYPLLGAGEIGTGRVKCRRCGKVTLEWAAGEHRRICNHVLDGTPLTTKKLTKASKTTDINKKRRASEASDHQTSPKKRAKFPAITSLAESTEAEDDDDRPLHSLSSYPNSNSHSQSQGQGLGLANAHSFKGMKKAELKKLEKEKMRIERKEAKEKERMEIAERKRMRASNPINLDRQCGVINDKSHPCARSLTCKTHTVGAKRAVQGRSRPYDLLYLEWQREHNPNFKEPVKKEKEKEKENKKADAASKKKKSGLRKNNDDVLEEDEDGFRELEELVGLTRLAGERVRGGFAMLGQSSPSTSGPSPAPIPIATIGPNGIPKLNPAAAAQNRERDREAANANSNGSGAAGSNGNGGGSGKNGGGGGGSKTSINGGLGNGTGTGTGNGQAMIPFQAIWRSSATEFASVGNIVVKALNARPSPSHAGHTGGAGLAMADGSGGKSMKSGGGAGALKMTNAAASAAGLGGGLTGQMGANLFGVTA
ncbi:hypothetical protein IAU59_001978 [Kwoniella sp. CBS 9459]